MRATSQAAIRAANLSTAKSSSALALANRSFATKAEIHAGLQSAVATVAGGINPVDDKQSALLKENLSLVEKLVTTSAARATAKNPDNFSQMIKRAKQNNPAQPDAAAREILKNILEHPLELMYTIHPTWVLLQDVIQQTFAIQETAIKFHQSPDITGKNIVEKLLPEVSGPITHMLLSSLVMNKKMTLEGELTRVAEYEADAAEQMPAVVKSVLKTVQEEVYGATKMPEDIRKSLTDVTTDMLSKQGMWFDLDGRKTTPDMVARITQIPQEVRTARLIKHAETLLAGAGLGDKNREIIQSYKDYWVSVEYNRKKKGGMGVYYSLDTAEIAAKRTLEGGLNTKGELKGGLNSILYSNDLSTDARKIVEKMVGIVTAGYARKGPIDTRRDSSVYNTYVEDVYKLLKELMEKELIVNDPSSPASLQKSFADMKSLLENPKYMAMNEAQQIQFEKLLGIHGTFFGSIVEHFGSLPEDTRNGIQIMAQQVSNGDNPRLFIGEIISETGTHGTAYGDVHRVLLLQNIARAVALAFKTGHYGTLDRNIKILIEQKAGLLTAGDTVRGLLKDSSFRDAIAAKGELDSVVSMSDNTLKYGPHAKVFVAKSIIAMKASLQEAKDDLWLRANSEKNPQFKKALQEKAELFGKVRFKARIGGGDGERNAGPLSGYSTMQGHDITLGIAEPGALNKTFRATVGQETGMDEMCSEISKLEQENQAQDQLLIKVAHLCTDAHNKFFESHGFRKACATIIGKDGAALLSMANPGSRLAAKKDSEVTGSSPDVALSRAITVDTAKYITGLSHPARSFSAVLSLSEAEKKLLPELGKLLIFKKMINYDVYSQIAYSDYPRAEQKLRAANAPSEEMAAIDQSKVELLQAMYGASYFLEPENGLKIRNYLDSNQALPPHELAFGAMEASGNPTLSSVAAETMTRRNESVVPARECLDAGKIREATLHLRGVGDVFRPLSSLQGF